MLGLLRVTRSHQRRGDPRLMDRPLNDRLRKTRLVRLGNRLDFLQRLRHSPPARMASPASASLVPPHIQPQIAQAPNAIRVIETSELPSRRASIFQGLRK